MLVSSKAVHGATVCCYRYIGGQAAHLNFSTVDIAAKAEIFDKRFRPGHGGFKSGQCLFRILAAAARQVGPVAFEAHANCDFLALRMRVARERFDATCTWPTRPKSHIVSMSLGNTAYEKQPCKIMAALCLGADLYEAAQAIAECHSCRGGAVATKFKPPTIFELIDDSHASPVSVAAAFTVLWEAEQLVRGAGLSFSVPEWERRGSGTLREHGRSNGKQH